MPQQVDLKYDVIVVGGGPAGLVAAVAAGRNGAKTLLIERLGFLGGEPITGLILHGFHNQRGEQVVHGIPGELIERLHEQGYAVRRVEMAKHRTTAAAISVDHEAMKYVAMEMVLEAGVEILFHTVLTDVVMEGNVVRGVTVYNKSGFHTYLAKAVVDASGDGDVAAKAGAKFEMGRLDDGLMQPLTLMFTLAGVALERVVEATGLAHGRAAEGSGEQEKGQVMWFRVALEPWAEQAAKEGLFPEVEDKRTIVVRGNAFRKGEANMNATFLNLLDGTNARDLATAEIECRRQAVQLTDFLKRHVPGFENAYITRSAPHIGVRETRRIIGDYYLTYDDFVTEAKFEDAIARSGFFADIHDPKPTGGMHEPERGVLGKSRGDFDVPYRSLLPQGIEGLLVAGRCISASHEAQASLRVTGPVMAIGQAAGTAAALAAKAEVGPRAVDVKDLQRILIQQGADLHQKVPTQPVPLPRQLA